MAILRDHSKKVTTDNIYGGFATRGVDAINVDVESVLNKGHNALMATINEPPLYTLPPVVNKTPTMEQDLYKNVYRSRIVPNIEIETVYSNGLSKDIYAFFSDGVELLFKSVRRVSNWAIVDGKFNVVIRYKFNPNVSAVGDYTEPTYIDNSAGTGKSAKQIIKDTFESIIRNDLGNPNRPENNPTTIGWVTSGHRTPITPSDKLQDTGTDCIYGFTEADFLSSKNGIIYSKELNCVLVYGIENLPQYNPHPNFSGVDNSEFFKRADASEGLNLELFILDVNGELNNKQYYVNIMGAQSVVPIIGVRLGFQNTGLYISRYQYTPEGYINYSQKRMEYKSIEDALKEGLIFESVEDASLYGNAEGRAKLRLVELQIQKDIEERKSEETKRAFEAEVLRLKLEDNECKRKEEEKKRIHDEEQRLLKIAEEEKKRIHDEEQRLLKIAEEEKKRIHDEEQRLLKIAEEEKKRIYDEEQRLLKVAEEERKRIHDTIKLNNDLKRDEAELVSQNKILEKKSNIETIKVIGGLLGFSILAFGLFSTLTKTVAVFSTICKAVSFLAPVSILI